MTDPSLAIEWKRFADTIGGKVGRTDATYFNRNNSYQISSKNVVINLVCGVEPQRGRGSHITNETIFHFPLNGKPNSSFRIYPKDALTSFLSFFGRSAQKTGDSQLDRAYIFRVDDTSLLYSITAPLKKLVGQSRHKDFVLSIEAISGTHFLTIQVNELIIYCKDLIHFYEFGQSVKEKINIGV